MTQRPWWDTEFDDLRVEARTASGRRVAVVTFDLPDRRNSMSTAMTASWVRLMGQLRTDEALAAVVVTGAPPAFSAGFALALACDLRYAAADAKLGVPFTSLGLHPGMATTWSLPNVAGHAVARDLLLTGRIVEGEEAVRLGLASRALPADEVLGEALAAAERIAAAAPVAARLTLQALRGGGHADHETALQWEALAQATTLATADVHEGIAAAAGRRTPQFRGK